MLKMKGLFAVVLVFVFGPPVLSLPVDSTCPNEQSSNKRIIVLTIDTSGSMESQGKLLEVVKALEEWILSLKSCSIQLAMVDFSSSARKLSGLVKVNENSRKKLVEKIPVRGQGESCVLCGLKAAFKILNGSNNSRDTSVILVITDADKSDLDWDKKFESYVEASQVQVAVALLSNEEDVLNQFKNLTELTNGFVSHIQNDSVYSDLIDVLNSVETRGLDNVSMVLTTEKDTILSNTSISTLTSTVSTTEVSNDISTQTSITLFEDTAEISQISKNVTTVNVSTTPITLVTSSYVPTLVENITADLTTSVLNESYFTTFGDNETDDASPTSTTTPVVDAFPPWVYLGLGAIIVISVVATTTISYLCYKKAHKRPFPRHGSYATIPLRPIHGDQVLVSNYALRPNSCYS